jgi:hypothetical protein
MSRKWFKKSPDDQRFVPNSNVEYALYDGVILVNDDITLIAQESEPGKPYPFAGYRWGDHCPEAEVLTRAILRNLTDGESPALHQKVMACEGRFYEDIIVKLNPATLGFWSMDVLRFLRDKCGIDPQDFQYHDHEDGPGAFPNIPNPIAYA